MSLRTRIAAAAGLAVAAVVLVAAAAIYFGVRAELRGEVDSSLRERAALFVSLAEGPQPDGAPGDRGPAGGGEVAPPAGGEGSASTRLPAPRPVPFGGPEGV